MFEAFAPQELTRDIPYITVVGDCALYIEHHHGMISYCPEKIVFETGCGLVVIAGSNLVVERYSSSDVGLKGQIDTVTFCKNGR